MPNERSLTILHLSDLQFGRDHRFGRLQLPSPDAEFDTLLARLSDDLILLRKEHDLKPDLLVVTGDLTESGSKKEFQDALQFVRGLMRLLALLAVPVVTLLMIGLIPGMLQQAGSRALMVYTLCTGVRRDGATPWVGWSAAAGIESLSLILISALTGWLQVLVLGHLIHAQPWLSILVLGYCAWFGSAMWRKCRGMYLERRAIREDAEAEHDEVGASP